MSNLIQFPIRNDQLWGKIEHQFRSTWREMELPEAEADYLIGRFKRDFDKLNVALGSDRSYAIGGTQDEIQASVQTLVDDLAGQIQRFTEQAFLEMCLLEIELWKYRTGRLPDGRGPASP